MGGGRGGGNSLLMKIVGDEEMKIQLQKEQEQYFKEE